MVGMTVPVSYFPNDNGIPLEQFAKMLLEDYLTEYRNRLLG